MSTENEVKNLVEDIAKTVHDQKEADKKGRDDLVTKMDSAMEGMQDEIKEMKIALARTEVEEGIEEAKDLTTHEKAFASYAIKGEEADLREFKAMNTGTPADGGFLVPPSLEKGIVKLERELVPMRQIARVVSLKSAVYNKNIQDGFGAGGWVTEEGNRSTTQTPTFTQIQIAPHELYANPQVTLAMLEDDGFGLEGWLAEEVSAECAVIENAAFVNGSGTGQPKGLSNYHAITGSPLDGGGVQEIKVVPAAGVTVGGNDLHAMVYDVNPAYRAGACFMMNRSTLQSVRTLKDLDGRYLFYRAGSGLDEASIVGYLLGFPVYENEEVVDVATGAYPIYFGNMMKGYTIVDRVGMSTLRNPYKTHGFVEFYTRKRVGGGVEDANALRVLQMA